MSTPVHEKTFPSDRAAKLPRPFILRRLHSLMGVWLIGFLCEHLWVNSQAGYGGGEGFVRAVNRIHAIPLLPVVEVLFLGFPFFIHIWWGVVYLRTGKLNAHRTDGTKPALGQYRRNRAFGWQRITAWLLIVGVVAHVVQMRFVKYPAEEGGMYQVRVERAATRVEEMGAEVGEGVATVPEAGQAFLINVYEVMASPVMVLLYSAFVLAAAFHAFNGLWTAFISWGVTLSRRSQLWARRLVSVLMAVLVVLGLVAVWGSYWAVAW